MEQDCGVGTTTSDDGAPTPVSTSQQLELLGQHYNNFCSYKLHEKDGMDDLRMSNQQQAVNDDTPLASSLGRHSGSVISASDLGSLDGELQAQQKTHTDIVRDRDAM